MAIRGQFKPPFLQEVPNLFWGLIAAYSSITAKAVSGGRASQDCLYALDATASRALMLSGTINSSCAAYVNSSNSDALHLDGGSSMTASTTIDVVGSYTNSGAPCTPCRLRGRRPLPTRYRQPLRYLALAPTRIGR